MDRDFATEAHALDSLQMQLRNCAGAVDPPAVAADAHALGGAVQHDLPHLDPLVMPAALDAHEVAVAANRRPVPADADALAHSARLRRVDDLPETHARARTEPQRQRELLAASRAVADVVTHNGLGFATEQE
jgi:hypothetical protein